MSDLINKSFFTVDAENEGTRIDKFLTEVKTELSRSFLQKLISEGNLTVNQKPVKANYRVQPNDKIELCIPDLVEAEILPENIELDILFEDNDIIIVNKPKGMVVHPAAGHYRGTLVNALMYHCKENLSGINGVLRPGIVHRIDMDTSGILVVCKNDKAHQNISEQLKVHSISRVYNAVVYGNFGKPDGIVNAPIGRHQNDRLKMAINYKNGKEAITHYTVLEGFNKFSYIECRLETGRTHQIRVHMASIQHPLLGDTVYGPSSNKYNIEGQVLHAGLLGFIHPTTNKYVEFKAPLPEYFDKLLEKLRMS